MEKSHLDILLEDIRGKFDLVLEGHSALDKKIDNRFDELDEKIEHNSFVIGVLNQKIDAVAADLAAHRADTEVHRGVYRVKEGDENFSE
jgi:Txe/YoeB family toxin of Txe-Axe toxin-antitoxin module